MPWSQIRRKGGIGRRGRRSNESGQALVEFSIVGTFFLLLVLGIINFGYTFEKKIVIASAANNGARYGATHAISGLSNAASPPSASIQGVIRATSANVTIANSDSNILIRYYKLGAGSTTLCGTYGVATAGNGITYVAGYTSATCGIVGDLIDVKVIITTTFVAPVLSDLFKNGVTLNNEVTTVIAAV